MLVGVEVIGSQLSDSDRRDLAALNPDFVKVRRPGLVADVLDVLPEVSILARADGEGYDVGDIANGYDHWRDALARYAGRILAYEFANEVNAKPVDPVWWVAGVIDWLTRLTGRSVPFMAPGLVPNVRIAEWAAALNRLPAATYRGVHCYWQQNGPEQAVQEALSQAAGVPDSSYIFCTEMNAAGASAAYQPTLDQRADECRRAMSAFAQAGIRAACLFNLTPWSGGDWEYAYPIDVTRSILSAGRAAPKRHRQPKPKPVPEVLTMPTLADVQKDAYLTTLPDLTPDQVNDTTGLYQAWLERKAELGTPTTGEIALDDGRVAQRFATGKILVYDNGAIEVV